MSVIFSDLNNTAAHIYVANDSTPKFLYKNLAMKISGNRLRSGTAVSEDAPSKRPWSCCRIIAHRTPLFSSTNFPMNTATSIAIRRLEFLPTFPTNPECAAFASLREMGNGFFDADNDGWLDLISLVATSIRRWTLFHRSALQRNRNFAAQSKRRHVLRRKRTSGPLSAFRAFRARGPGDLFNTGNVDIVVKIWPASQ